jgi:FtsH-binding integral membrane protein
MHPFSAGPLSLVPAAGALCLWIGAIAAIVYRERQLLWFLLCFALSQGLVFLAGLFRGSSSSAGPFLWAFLACQTILAGYLVWRCRGARVAAVPLALFCVTYALFAGLIAAMALSNRWL